MNFAGLEALRRPLRAGRARRSTRWPAGGVNSPKASSCGRLFDAVAAALDLCRERQSYEGEAGARLEAIVDRDAMRRDDEELGLSVRHPQSRRRRPALYRTAGDVAGAARRSHPEDAGAADRGALPQGPRQGRRRDGEEARPSRRARAAPASTRSPCRAAVSRTAFCSRRSCAVSKAENFTVLSHAQRPGQRRRPCARTGGDRRRASHRRRERTAATRSSEGISAMCLGIPGRIETDRRSRQKAGDRRRRRRQAAGQHRLHRQRRAPGVRPASAIGS